MAKRYTAKDRQRVFAAYLMQGGNVSATERETGVSHNTIVSWVEGYPDELDATRNAFLRDVGDFATRLIKRSLQRTDEELHKCSAYQAAAIAKMITDVRAKILEGVNERQRPSEVVSKESEDRLSKAIERLAEKAAKQSEA